MKLLQTIFSLIYVLIFPAAVFAHESEVLHEEVPATVDPMLAIGVVVIVLIGGIIIWKVMFGKKKTPAVQSTNAQTETPKVESQPSQPENLEIKK